MKTTGIPNNIDEYIAIFPFDIQEKLEELRAIIKKAAPEAQEKISYQMPAFTLKGNLVYFAAYKNHIGFYPTASGIAAFSNELSAYKSSKGTVRFPLDKPLPIGLIADIVTYRVQENLVKTSAKKTKK
jgi:uncharacterized protein YdhG (YjbR/CyaY superfamily)